MLIVNGGWMLNRMWSYVTPWLDPITAKRIVVCESTEKLHEYIDTDQVTFAFVITSFVFLVD